MRARHAVIASGFSLVVPALALAQPPPRPPVTPIPASESKAPSTWRFTLSADANWYENAYFLGPIADETAWSTDGRASLGYERRFREGTFTLSGFGGGIYYPEIDVLNQPTYGGAFDLSWTPSRRTTLKLAQRYERSNTRYLQAVDSEGLPLPTSGADYATSSIGLEQKLSQRWQLGLDGSFNYRRYDDPLLTGSDQVYATARLGRRIGRRGIFNFSYAYSAAWFDEGKERAHQALVGGRRVVERGVGFDVSAGVGYLESTEEIYPAGSAGISAVGRRAKLDLVYYRDFGQAYGYARQMIGDLVAARLSWSVVRRVTLSAGYNYGYRRDPTVEDYTIVSGIASASLNWQVGGGVDFGAGYSWERNETEGLPVIEGGRATASLKYGVNWQ